MLLRLYNLSTQYVSSPDLTCWNETCWIMRWLPVQLLVYMGVLFSRFPLAARKDREDDSTDHPRRAPPDAIRVCGASQNQSNCFTQQCLQRMHLHPSVMWCAQSCSPSTFSRGRALSSTSVVLSRGTMEPSQFCAVSDLLMERTACFPASTEFCLVAGSK